MKPPPIADPDDPRYGDRDAVSDGRDQRRVQVRPSSGLAVAVLIAVAVLLAVVVCLALGVPVW
ncbi:MAG: hypothetical protein ACRDSF_00690, partial [Pseudonocardiaceae bacterium]